MSTMKAEKNMGPDVIRIRHELEELKNQNKELRSNCIRLESTVVNLEAMAKEFSKIESKMQATQFQLVSKIAKMKDENSNLADSIIDLKKEMNDWLHLEINI